AGAAHLHRQVVTTVFGVVFAAHHVGECFRPVVVVVLYAQTPFILAEYNPYLVRFEYSCSS
ncbi:hypothetical protein LT671_01555, partial [Escherichia coli]